MPRDEQTVEKLKTRLNQWQAYVDQSENVLRRPTAERSPWMAPPMGNGAGEHPGDVRPSVERTARRGAPTATLEEGGRSARDLDHAVARCEEKIAELHFAIEEERKQARLLVQTLIHQQTRRRTFSPRLPFRLPRPGASCRGAAAPRSPFRPGPAPVSRSALFWPCILVSLAAVFFFLLYCILLWR